MGKRAAADSGMPPAWAVRLQAARVMSGQSQTAFAKILGMSQQRYGLYETGKTEPNIETWTRISAILGVSIDFLFTGKSHERGGVAPIPSQQISHD
jgi:DNA-binding XRE family transcriptional regulator